MAAAPVAEKAAHADALATTISTPNVFNGDAAGRKTSGAEAVETFAEAGKATTRERAMDAFTEVALVHERVALVSNEDFAGAMHDPAVDAVDAFAVHWHAVQPAVCAAASEQQHPPRHASVTQSDGDAHSSPRLTVRHAPVCEEQVEQPRRTDELEQQKPPRQAEEEHAELLKQGAPGDAAAEPVLVIDEERTHVEIDDAPANVVA